MNKSQKSNRDYETLAWGLLLIWWGLRWSLLASLPNGTGLLGTGTILLGLNVIRSLTGIPVRNNTSAIGVLALVVGGMLLAREILKVPFEIPVFEIVLISFGAFLLIRAFRKPATNIECC